MLRIDRKSHRYLIEPLSGIKHLKRTLLEAFMNFTKKLSNSPKKSVKNVYDLIRKDCRSVTGSNIRNIYLECAVDEHRPFSDINIKTQDFFSSPPEAEWKIPIIRELIDMRDDLKGNAGFTKEDIEYTLEYLCTS